MNLRSPNSDEIRAVSALANLLPEHKRRQLLLDLESAQAETVAPDGSCVKFALSGYDRPKYRGQHPYEFEGKLLDADGVELDLIVYADKNDRLLELEIIRWADGPLIQPNWNTLTFL